MRKLILSIIMGGILIVGSLYFSGVIAGSKKDRKTIPRKVVKTVFVDTVTNTTVPIIIPAFFFSSRRRHTKSLCDWSSDVCSSDLLSFLFLNNFDF